jgi:hypothetical protein
MGRSMFSDLHFYKTGAEIKSKCELRVDKVLESATEREKLIDDLTKQMGLKTAADVLLHMDDLDDLVSNARAESPVKAKLHQAVGSLRDKREEIDSLQMVIRNIDTSEKFKLSFSALEYLGF